MKKINLVRKMRILLGFSTTDVGKMLNRTRRAVEIWESDKGRGIPKELLKLFIREYEDLCLVKPAIIHDGQDNPWDIITFDTFVSLTPSPPHDDNREIYLVRTISVGHDGRPYLHGTYFDTGFAANRKAIEIIKNWPGIIEVEKTILSSTLLSPFHIDR